MTRRLTSALVLTALAAIACGGSTTDDDLGQTGTAGSGGAGSGGASAGSAGTSGSAGTAGTAGASGTGASAGSAGTSGKGGSAGAAGSSGKGGAGATGGSAGTGGSSGKGGAAGSSGKGGAAGSSGAGGKPQCTTPAECPLPGVPCQICADGTSACPTADCLQGKCVYSFPTCPAPTCTAQDALPEGKCNKLLGWKWNGASCEALGGCSCTGADCAKLYPDAATCASSHAGCPAPDPCAGKLCGELCDACLPGQPCPDVVTYCDAKGACTPSVPTCTAPTCAAQDANGEGLCDGFMGYKWDGSACTAVTGCTCVGADCKGLPFDKAICEKAHVDCATDPCAGKSCGDYCSTCPVGQACPPVIQQCNAKGQCSTEAPVCTSSCGPADAHGVGACAAFFGYAWDGKGCVGIGGCSCVGADCGALLPTEQDCLAKHAACACAGKMCGESCVCSTPPCANTPYYCDYSSACVPGAVACPQFLLG